MPPRARENPRCHVSASDQFVYLQAGLVVPVEAFNVVLQCEALGITLSHRDGSLDVDGPYTADLLATLKRLKPHVLAILRYEASDAHLFDSSLPFPEHGPIHVRRPL